MDIVNYIVYMMNELFNTNKQNFYITNLLLNHKKIKLKYILIEYNVFIDKKSLN